MKKIDGNFKNKDIVSLDQFDKASILKLFKVTEKVRKMAFRKSCKILVGKMGTLLFYEPSSRTFSSFASAIKQMGGQTIEYQNPMQTSSAVKGETLEDTIRVFENYCDFIIIRHPEVGTAEKAAEAAERVPVINGGDGIGEHPTQALMDLYTIYSQFGKLNNLTGLMAGDLLYGRTVHSLMRGLSNFSGNTLYLLSPKSLKLELGLVKELLKRKIKLIEIESEKEIPDDCHFWYWTRVQKERFKSLSDYEKVKNSFILTPLLLRRFGNKKMIIMHPLPRVGEIETRVDSDPRAIYLTRQIQNGVYVRKALLGLVLGRI